jgi:dCMP deaminase
MSSIRPSKDRYYVNVAREVATRSTCLVSKYGSIIVKNDRIISSGYNGAPRKVKNCVDTGTCIRNITGLSRYNACRAVHSEANALLHANYEDMLDSVLYIYRCESSKDSHDVVEPCISCKRLILNAKIKRVVCQQEDGTLKEHFPENWIDKV